MMLTCFAFFPLSVFTTLFITGTCSIDFVAQDINNDNKNNKTREESLQFPNLWEVQLMQHILQTDIQSMCS